MVHFAALQSRRLYAPTVAATAAAVVIIGFAAVSRCFCRVLTIVLTLGGRER